MFDIGKFRAKFENVSRKIFVVKWGKSLIRIEISEAIAVPEISVKHMHDQQVQHLYTARDPVTALNHYSSNGGCIARI